MANNFDYYKALAQDALNLVDPTGCMQVDYEDEIVAIIQAIRAQEPAFAMSLDLSTLATYIQQAMDQDQALDEILQAAAQSHAMFA